jgi:hypothetical protein
MGKKINPTQVSLPSVGFTPWRKEIEGFYAILDPIKNTLGVEP